MNLDTKMLRAPKSKSGKDYWVPINDDLLAILQQLPSRLRSRWVFPNQTNTGPVDPKNFKRRVFDPAVARAGIEDFRWHDLRHTFASRLRMKDTDLKTISELMGHTSTAMTERYAHVTPGHRREAVQRLNRAGRTDTPTDTSREHASAAVESGTRKRR